MKKNIPWAGALLASALAASIACADPHYADVSTESSSGACGPGCSGFGHGGKIRALLSSTGCCGLGCFSAGHGWGHGPPSYWFRPTGEPLTPFYPAINCLGPYYVTHPAVRGPRDFFMWRENMEDQLRREQRPGLVP